MGAGAQTYGVESVDRLLRYHANTKVSAQWFCIVLSHVQREMNVYEQQLHKACNDTHAMNIWCEGSLTRTHTHTCLL